VGGGGNAVILHYVENSAPLQAGQLLLVDAGCEVSGGFTADVTRTFPIGRPFTAAQRRLYEAVLEVQMAAIDAVKPGATIDGIHAQVVEGLTRRMVDLGLFKGKGPGDVPALIAEEKYKAFYMHRTSHWLGIDVHDVGFYSVEGAARPLEAGMVLTIEPGLYVAEDAADVPAELRGIGVRIEDDILVTAAGHENLTRETPKSVAELEALAAA
jgi:Xaa-Pro aminopeptidase